MKTYSLRCKSCGGVLDANNDREILFCPYCGSKELVDISDKVRIERIRSETKRGILTDLYDARQRSRQQKIEKQEKEREDERKNFPIIIALMIFFLLFYYITRM